VVPPTLITPRLRVRALSGGDMAFILTLLNDPSFIRNIGDRGVRTPDDALAYITDGPMASYARHRFGLCAVELIASGHTIGICGLLQRDELPGPDIGFAFLPQYWSMGYAFEAASAVIDDARARLGVTTLLAIANPDNAASIRLLERLGFTFARLMRLRNEARDLKLFAAGAAVL
jgi:ribosomal-protein-alanine N-acetyltransferase